MPIKGGRYCFSSQYKCFFRLPLERPEDATRLRDTARKKLIRQYYSIRAVDYDRQKNRTWKSSQGFGSEVSDELLMALEEYRGKRVLEVGVGTGRNASTLLERVKPQLVGLDLTREMLRLAKMKMCSHKDSFDLILADAEHMPFIEGVFDALVCMSTMHYFSSQELMLNKLRNTLKKRGTFVYGDLTIPEEDDEGFFERLERTLSKAHTGYLEPSTAKQLMEKLGFLVLKTKTVAYRKSYGALFEDKGRYFGVLPETFKKFVDQAPTHAKQKYELSDTEMTLF